jgi:hypothetical protein
VIRFRIVDALQVEPRVYFGGSGTVTLRTVSFSRVPSVPPQPTPQPVP